MTAQLEKFKGKPQLETEAGSRHLHCLNPEP